MVTFSFFLASRKMCIRDSYKAMPRDIEADCAYTFEDMFTGEVRTIPGATLLENGFDIALEKRGAAIWFYEKAGR